jgi:dUTP pyrophosphatase
MTMPDDSPTIYIQRLRPRIDSDIPLPDYMTAQSAGMDICAAVTDDAILQPGEIQKIPTGFAIALPPGYEAQVRPRSGLAVQHGITLINSPGTIDADYRGEVQIALINHGKKPVVIHRRDRIAQLVIHRVYQARLVETETLDKTGRDTGGFGHTGR